jgi:5-methylcytosine-specific restriction endonuclease McrA
MRKEKEGNRSRQVAQLNRIYKRDHGFCYRCRLKVKRVDASRDHIIPISECTMEQARSDSNILLAHKLCNSNRGTEPIDMLTVAYKTSKIDKALAGHLTYKIGDIFPLGRM